MRVSPAAFAFSATLLFAACGASGPEAKAEESVALMEQIGDALESAVDEASAKAAASKLTPIMARMAALRTEMEGMDKPAKNDALEAKYAERTKAAMSKMMAQMGRVMSDQKLGAILEPVLSKMGK